MSQLTIRILSSVIFTVALSVAFVAPQPSIALMLGAIYLYQRGTDV